MCLLRVMGATFAADDWLARSGLRACDVFRADVPADGSRAKRHGQSGFSVDVSREALDDLSRQVADALEFVRRHDAVLRMLSAAPGVECFALDFAVPLVIDRKTVFAQFEHFPAELVSSAGAVGLSLTLAIYPRDLARLAEDLTTGGSA